MLSLILSRKYVQAKDRKVAVQCKSILNALSSADREAGAVCEGEFLVMITFENRTSLEEVGLIDPHKRYETPVNQLKEPIQDL
jgi:hypothetical protein